MTELQELKLLIATSINAVPCTEKELCDRDFLKNRSNEGISRIVMILEKDGAIYYKGDTMYIYKNWANKNL